MSKKDEQLERIMKNLKCSREEALQLMADDDDVDHGKRMEFDLSPEEEKKAKKYINASEHKAPKSKVERKRKENPTKQGFISAIATFLKENSEISVENLQILNKEREISFDCDGFNYSVTLIQHRKPKS